MAYRYKIVAINLSEEATSHSEIYFGSFYVKQHSTPSTYFPVACTLYPSPIIEIIQIINFIICVVLTLLHLTMYKTPSPYATAKNQNVYFSVILYTYLR